MLPNLVDHVIEVKRHGVSVPECTVEHVRKIDRPDLESLVDATLLAIEDGGGFGWVKTPHRDTLRAFWEGVSLIPERKLFVGRLDGIVAGAVQLVRFPRNNEAQSRSAVLSSAFVAPPARGYGVARALIQTAENAAQLDGIKRIEIDLRATQEKAIILYRDVGYLKWGENPHYAFIDGKWVAGHYMAKDLENPISL
ncbi:MAG: GNAT family N-acetyltransferase [Alphaproteobacteria bacterium]|nr:GNAT family N-acetyltransferase [Alphaproteobacteria bacterium]